MAGGWIAGAISIVAALIGQLRLTSRPDRVRRKIASTIELLESLSTRSELEASRDRVIALIDEQTVYLDKLERRAMERKYDPSQPIVGLLFGLPLGYLAFRLWVDTDRWFGQVTAVLVALIAAFVLWVGISGFFRPPRAKPTVHTPVATAGRDDGTRSAASS